MTYHRGRFLPKTAETLPAAILKPYSTFQIHCLALLGGSNVVYPQKTIENPHRKLLEKSVSEIDIFFASKQYTEDGFVKIDIPEGHKPDRIAN